MSKLGGQSTKMLPMLQDEMQKRRMMKRATTPVARFQTRVFVLYKHQLVYKTKDEKQVKGSISVMGIKICEDVDDAAFDRNHVFQVGYIEKGKMYHLYIQAKSSEMRDKWKLQIRKLCATYNDHRMQQKFHLGHFKSKNWTCCESGEKNNTGCQEAYKYLNKDSPLMGTNRKYHNQLSEPTLLRGQRTKTPNLFRGTNIINLTPMPSDCCDSDTDEMTSSLSPPGSCLEDISEEKRYNQTYRLEHRRYSNVLHAVTERTPPPGRLSVYEMENAYFGKSDNTYRKKTGKAPLSSRSFRFSNDKTAPRLTPRYSETADPMSNWDDFSRSIPNYYALNEDSRTSSLSSSSTAAVAGSEHSSRFGSMISHMEVTRLDSTGSTVASSFTDQSIPRTESGTSDYQRWVDDRDFSGVIYTSSVMSENTEDNMTDVSVSGRSNTTSAEHSLGYETDSSFSGEACTQPAGDDNLEFSEEKFTEQVKNSEQEATEAALTIDTPTDVELQWKLFGELASESRSASGTYENYPLRR